MSTQNETKLETVDCDLNSDKLHSGSLQIFALFDIF